MTLTARLPTLTALACAALLTACGGGSGSAPVAAAPDPVTSGGTTTVPPSANAPAATGITATDGFNWFNYRRAQMGLAVLARNELVDRAALGHSNYQKANNQITHDQTAGKPGFTGVTLLDRLTAAGYLFAPRAGYAYGEVISATSETSGVYMAEELIAAIYHRFVVFEPRFKEMGAASATVPNGYTYFTADFTANEGYAPGMAAGKVAVYPFENQTGVPRNFFSDYEMPDPVPGRNEVGYPVSVHANIDSTVVVQSFTLAPRGGTPVDARLLTYTTDAETVHSAAALIPLSPLTAGATYTATFSGLIDNVPVTRSWSFTVR